MSSPFARAWTASAAGRGRSTWRGTTNSTRPWKSRFVRINEGTRATPMTVAGLMDTLSKMPKDALVLMESDGGLSRVAALDFIEGQGAGAPAEVILLPSMEE